MGTFFGRVFHWIEVHPGLTTLAAIVTAAAAFITMAFSVFAIDHNIFMTHKTWRLTRKKTNLEIEELLERREERKNRILRP